MKSILISFMLSIFLIANPVFIFGQQSSKTNRSESVSSQHKTKVENPQKNQQKKNAPASTHGNSNKQVQASKNDVNGKTIHINSDQSVSIDENKIQKDSDPQEKEENKKKQEKLSESNKRIEDSQKEINSTHGKLKQAEGKINYARKKTQEAFDNKRISEEEYKNRMASLDEYEKRMADLDAENKELSTEINTTIEEKKVRLEAAHSQKKISEEEYKIMKKELDAIKTDSRIQIKDQPKPLPPTKEKK